MERRPRTQPENYNTEREGEEGIQKLAKYLFRGTKQGTQLFMASAPHVRGEVRIRFAATICGGITPACAGRSARRRKHDLRNEDHPRVRGEKLHYRPQYILRAGSPPRARGEAHIRPVQQCGGGITPACAGRSEITQITDTYDEDHPRVRGEKAALPQIAKEL